MSPLTGFPHGVSSFGIPVLGGGGRTLGLWGTTYFVDNDSGDDGNTGKTPTSAFLNLKAALDVAIEGDTIYIRPKKADADNHYIRPAAALNWTIASTARGLSIIGASNGSQISSLGGRYMVYLRGHASVTTGEVIKVDANNVTLENLAFHPGALAAVTSSLSPTSAGVRIGAHAAGQTNSTIYNCYFKLFTSPAVMATDSWYTEVNKCLFDRCRWGFSAHGSDSSLVSQRVVDCMFIGPAANISTSVIIYSDSANDRDNIVQGCIFMHPVPSQGGYNNYVYIKSGAGLITDCRAADANMQATTDYVIPAGVLMTQNYDDSDAEWGTT